MHEETVHCFILAFETLEYKVCAHGQIERGFEKVAIYVDSAGTPTHIARQLQSGLWTSKCGDLEDLQHDSLDALGGEPDGYGSVITFMKRPMPGSVEEVQRGCLARIWPSSFDWKVIVERLAGAEGMSRANLAIQMASMKPIPTIQESEGTPFEKFERLFRVVPRFLKSEVEKAEAKERLKNRRRRARRKAAKRKA